MVSRIVTEGAKDQSADERIYYTLTTTPWGSSPTSVSVKAYDESDADTDATATVLTGSASVAGDVITLPLLHSLTALHNYRIEVKFTVADNVCEAIVPVRCTG